MYTCHRALLINHPLICENNKPIKPLHTVTLLHVFKSDSHVEIKFWSVLIKKTFAFCKENKNMAIRGGEGGGGRGEGEDFGFDVGMNGVDVEFYSLTYKI